MKGLPRLTIDIWAIVFIVLITLPLLIGQYFLNYSFYRDIQLKHSSQRLSDLADKINAQLLFPVATGEKKAVKAIVNEIMKDEEVRSVHVKDSDDGTIYHAESEAMKTGSLSDLIRKETLLEDIRPAVSDSVFSVDYEENGNNVYGTVVLYLQTTQADKQIASELQHRSSYYALLVILISVLIYLFTWRGYKHAQRIIAHIQDLLEGRYTKESKFSSIKEFEEISNGLNNLGCTLEEKISALEKSNEESKVAKELAEKAAYFKDEFVHIASHEIRTPVNTVANLVEILENHLVSLNADSLVMNHYGVCKGAVSDLRNIVEELVNFDKMERTDIELNNTVFNVEAFFALLEQQYAIKFSQKPVSISVTMIGKEPTSLVFSDEGKLKQVLTNIIDNAFKYTEQGSVSVTWSLEVADKGHALVIKCKDSGMGIPERDLERVFEPFYQVHKKRVYSTSGYGLGLSIVRNLIVALGGTIEVQSKENIGTEVRILIPISIASDNINQRESLPANLQKKSSYDLSAIVIDDDTNSCYTLAAMLSECGITCTTYNDPEDALDEIGELTADLVFIDLHMPSMNGFALASKLRNKQKKQNVRFVCVTADTHSSVGQAMEDSLMDSLIYKPICMADIVKILNSANEAKSFTFFENGSES